mmetsp:Transcript_63084/g.169118  ORF Transcript_63084/g.169118 Transcript_63084/m.169118 type:complete len:90 (+) Transcript_63084:1343-1612(+)
MEPRGGHPGSWRYDEDGDPIGEPPCCHMPEAPVEWKTAPQGSGVLHDQVTGGPLGHIPDPAGDASSLGMPSGPPQCPAAHPDQAGDDWR